MPHHGYHVLSVLRAGTLCCVCRSPGRLMSLPRELHCVVLVSGCAGAVFPLVAACFWSHGVGLVSFQVVQASNGVRECFCEWSAGVGIRQQTGPISVHCRGPQLSYKHSRATHYAGCAGRLKRCRGEGVALERRG
jgi:hypothetical protein